MADPPLPSPQASPSLPSGQGLSLRRGGDGSLSLWSQTFGEGFHSGRGALREARETFLAPSQLECLARGERVRVLEVCVGTGTNLAVLLEACGARGLRLDWIGLELDPEPLRLALDQEAFRAAWRPETLALLEQLRPSPQGPGPATSATSHCHLLWGDARTTLRQLAGAGTAAFDLIWHDAFSPRRCPELWSLEYLRQLARRLGPAGRWISYCSAAAVREALELAGLELAGLHGAADGSGRRLPWSGGTVASHQALPPSHLWRPLTAMEREHLRSSAGEPYRDPQGNAPAGQILEARQRAQAEALAAGRRTPSSAWRRQWGLQGRA